MEGKINIFILDFDPVKAAQLQCNAHVVKMVVESAQMLSTAHRMLDGKVTLSPSKSGKNKVKAWLLGDYRNEKLYRAVHINHPCTVWTRESKENYEWHYAHFAALCDEYTYRYNKVHKTDAELREILREAPKNIPSKGLTQFALAMKTNPECMFPNDPVKSYRIFYQTKQDRFKMSWTKREVPEWFKFKEVA